MKIDRIHHMHVFLEEWPRTKRAPRHGAFLHEREFK
jgi:hypothetical protein